ncbi:MAG: ATP-binding protein [Bradyrhizobium sp.]|nr:ATP-binding protein [Bradyrhizobium sp.]
MGIFGGNIESLTAHDVLQVCADHVPEGVEVEYKGDLPVKGGRAQDAWHTGGAVGEYARNAIAEEITAFANTMGGVVCIGIAETLDHPKRADKPQPLPRVHELARRIRQAVYDVIDPPLSVLEAVGVDLDGLGNGVVVLRVPPSRRRPHRHAVSKEVFYRRADESVRVSMREIQELTIQAVSEAARAEKKIRERRDQFRETSTLWLKNAYKVHEQPWGAALQFFAMPASPIDLVRVVGRPNLTNLNSMVIATTGRGNAEIKWPFDPTSQWRPGLRSISSSYIAQTRRAVYSLETDGTCEISMCLKLTEERPNIYEGWLLAGFGKILRWVERLKKESGTGVEYILAPQVSVFEKPAGLQGIEGADLDFGAQLPVGTFDFPLISVGSAEEESTLLRTFDADIWNLAGEDTLRRPRTFVLA